MTTNQRTHTRTSHDDNGRLVVDNVNDAGQIVTRTVLPAGTPVHTGDDVVIDQQER